VWSEYVPAVKPSRKYDSSGRRRQAESTRSAILETARTMFLADGYAATSIPAIARAAGVSAETIYKAFGPKSGLVRALWSQGLTGTGSAPIEQLSDALSSTEPDAVTLIRGWAQLMKDVAPAAATILLLIRAAAATDSEMASLQAETEQGRRERMTENARRLKRTGQVRPELDDDRIRDVLWLYSSSELYELLVLKSGWDLDAYVAFAAQSMIDALLVR
jgi:AcrR family transcriptional regulator